MTHVDYSARVQTVHRETNPLFYQLLQAFKSQTGCPVLVNTSFNVRGEPIVCTPEDAFRCFMGTDLDLLVVGRAMFVIWSSDLSGPQEDSLTGFVGGFFRKTRWDRIGTFLR